MQRDRRSFVVDFCQLTAAAIHWRNGVGATRSLRIMSSRGRHYDLIDLEQPRDMARIGEVYPVIELFDQTRRCPPTPGGWSELGLKPSLSNSVVISARDHPTKTSRKALRVRFLIRSALFSLKKAAAEIAELPQRAGCRFLR